MDFQFISIAEASVESLMRGINKVVINPIIIFLFAVALVYFVYGLLQYLMSSDNEEVRKKSKSHMIWGVVGLFIMVAVFGIMRLILSTVGENKIKINDAGDYVVDGSNLVDRATSDPKVGDAFKQNDLSTDVNAPDLPAATFTTSPFATYEQNALCWQKAIRGQANTEYNAIDTAKSDARKQYLAATGVLATDNTKSGYPIVFDTKVLYDKNAKVYHAWLDVRAPKGSGTMTNCNLNIISPAPVLPEGSMTTSYDLSTDVNIPTLPSTTFTTSPFATYKQIDLCWQRFVSDKANTEYGSINLVKAKARKQYLDENSVLATDKTKAKYPLTFGTKVLYNKTDKTYYAWLDVRAPVGVGTDTNCKLDMLTPAPSIPASVFTLGEQNLSTTTANSTITNYTTSPFTKIYTPSPLCWRKEVMGMGTTEYQALQQVKSKARSMYITENSLVEADVKPNYPLTYGVLTAYDKVTKNFYAWWDARGPILGGKDQDCNLPEFVRYNQSNEPNPLVANYVSNMTYFRVVDSGVDTTYVGSRSTAINNALIQIAQLKGLRSTAGFSYTILEEKYYPPIPATATYAGYPYYDYWVAVQAKR